MLPVSSTQCPDGTIVLVPQKLLVPKSPLWKYWIRLLQASLTRVSFCVIWYMKQRCCPQIWYVQPCFHQTVEHDRCTLEYNTTWQCGAVWGVQWIFYQLKREYHQMYILSKCLSTCADEPPKICTFVDINVALRIINWLAFQQVYTLVIVF